MTNNAAWYVVRLKPGATQKSKVDPRLTNIEHVLRQAGVEYYFPVECKETMHHRKKIWIDHRFPLIPGYVFVTDVADWYKLHQLNFVGRAIGSAGSPLKIQTRLIEDIRTAEDEIYLAYQHSKLMRGQREKEAAELQNGMSARKARTLYPAGSPVVVGGHHLLRGMKGRIIEATGRKTIKVAIETISGLINAEISTAHLEMVA